MSIERVRKKFPDWAQVYNATLVSTDDLVAAVAHAGNDGRHEYVAKLAPLQ